MKRIKQFMENKSQKYLIIMIILILLGGVIFKLHYLITCLDNQTNYTSKEPIYPLFSPDNTMEQTKDDKERRTHYYRI
ncbi:hypothetical protein [Vaccinium witches'-broom phytoplasma]|uniref:hypothetical protein n=1 Tax=Vaccinium witches'-broom phytoplasma TaxID=85642 RepID=UPI0012676576|nr:hypothetical protein [Vaccinium witches'-broom phytoplasma]